MAEKYSPGRRLVDCLLLGSYGPVIEFYFFVLLKGKIYGTENLPESGFILAANHASFLDWFIVYPVFMRKLKRRVYFLGHRKLFAHAFWGRFLKNAQTIPVDPGKPRSVSYAYAAAVEYLRRGEIVGIFPEGTRSTDGRLQQAKDGAAALALATGVPVVPVGLSGFWAAWPKGKKLPGIAPAAISIGCPLRFSLRPGEKRKAARKNVTKTIMTEIAKLLGADYEY
ncbi:MAG TPA: lysophospholipid acyltransferase family protein [Oligoflexia bacterium]|nr:lysophospholipid acyltransferase family protein [Oligoflexia bacterium]